MDNDFDIITMYMIVLPIIFGVMAAFFLIIGMRGIITKRPFLVSNKWLLWMMSIVFVPLICQPLFFYPPDIGLLGWLNPALYIVVLVMMFIALKGYVAYGVTDMSFREALLAALDKLQLPHEETLSIIRLTSLDTYLQVSVQSWVGAGQIKIKQREQRAQLAEIVREMNVHFQISSAAANLTSCIFFVVTGVLMVVGGIGVVFLFQNIG
ncbi:MAG: hypothetical protein OXD54_13340 [Candidatus Poribacteria bacterium]|nr:hypothetical protein [Candidatus Poribacteria bacterium]